MQAKGTVPGPHARTPALTARGQRTLTARPKGGQPREDERLTSDAPHNGAGHPPPGTPSHQPHSAKRRLARAHAVGLVLGPHARTTRARDTRAAGPVCPPPGDRRPGKGKRLTPDSPHNSERSPPGTASNHPRGVQPPTRHASQRDSAGAPSPHTRARSTRATDPDRPPRGGAAGGGRAPDLKRPSK